MDLKPVLTRSRYQKLLLSSRIRRMAIRSLAVNKARKRKR